MAEVTIENFAEVVGITAERLLQQIQDAGLPQTKFLDIISDRDKLVLLSHLREAHGEGSTSQSNASKRLEVTTENHDKKNTSPSELKEEQQKEPTPKVFISYSYDSETHQKWVEQLATMLRTDGIDTILDIWTLHPGDPITEFMEKGIRDSDFVLIICTEKYKNKSDARVGGVGYEDAIISSDMFSNSNYRKYIPILKSEDYSAAMPTTLHSKRFINLSNEDNFSASYRDLLLTLFGRRLLAPPIGKAPDYIFPKN